MCDVASLLKKSPEESEDKLRCQACGIEVDEGVDICPHCEEPVRLITLAELGRRLPIGIIDTKDGVKHLIKDFTVVKLDWTKEREISKAWKSISRRPNITMFDYVLCVLAHTVTNIGGIDFSKHNLEHRMHILGEMFAGDVFYMYAYLRVFSLGPEFDLRNLRCPSCNSHISRYGVDLSTIEVSTREDVDKLTQKVVLRNGFTLANGIRKTIYLQPASIRALSASTIEDDDAEFFANILKSTCVGIEGVEGAVITDQEIVQLEPYDLALIRDASDWIAGGVNWSVDVDCDCGFTFDQIIDWRYGNFFSLSSRSTMMRRHSKS